MTRTPESDLASLVAEIDRLPDNWHGCGTVAPGVLDAIIRHAARLDVRESVETGSGRSTLLFSHLSSHHVVFTLGHEGSESNVRESPLFRASSVEWVLGPTQRTLPRYEFVRPLQLAMIDGPHGYPFPDLEYYFLYPHLAPGALLIVDDVHIPTIDNLHRFLSADDMFEPLGVVEQTSFFRRTTAPTLDPFGDGWWLQGFNKQTLNVGPARAGARGFFDRLPSPVRRAARSFRRAVFGSPV